MYYLATDRESGVRHAAQIWLYGAAKRKRETPTCPAFTSRRRRKRPAPR